MGLLFWFSSPDFVVLEVSQLAGGFRPPEEGRRGKLGGAKSVEITTHDQFEKSLLK